LDLDFLTASPPQIFLCPDDGQNEEVIPSGGRKDRRSTGRRVGGLPVDRQTNRRRTNWIFVVDRQTVTWHKNSQEPSSVCGWHVALARVARTALENHSWSCHVGTILYEFPRESSHKNTTIPTPLTIH